VEIVDKGDNLPDMMEAECTCL